MYRKKWVVIKQNKFANASKFHETLKDAMEEAERLVIKENEFFGVFELIKLVGRQPTPIQWDDIKE